MYLQSEKIISEERIESLFIYKIKRIRSIIGLEASIWILGLAYLAFINSPGTVHFTICPFANLGIDFCPGCGLGNSISYLFRGDFISSFHSHPLGIFVLIIITIRILTIIKNNRRRYAQCISINAKSRRR